MPKPTGKPFSADGGLKVLGGNLGRAVIKVSAVKPQHLQIEAPVAVFDTQRQVLDTFKAGKLDRDVVVVVRNQGPRANGMPELHKLTPPLGVLQDKGFKVALVTDGRMSGASGKVPAAIHVTPEALPSPTHPAGPLAYLRDGDVIRLCAHEGKLEVLADLSAREPAMPPQAAAGMGREIFAMFRTMADGAEAGGSAMLASGGL